MPDLLGDDTYTNRKVPKRSSRNYSSGHHEDDVDNSGNREPRSSNPGDYSGARVTATIRETTSEQVNDPHRPRSFSSSGMDQKVESAGGTGRKRGFITGATVENRGSRSGRTSDMPLTDVEDFYDSDVGWRKSAGGGRQPSHVARIYVRGDDDNVGSQDDMVSVFSAPPHHGRLRSPNVDDPVLNGETRLLGHIPDMVSVFSAPPHHGRLRSPNVFPPRSITPVHNPRPFATLTPTYGPPFTSMPPTMPVPQGTFELAHVDTQIQDQLSPDVGSPEATISAVDPALRGARKQGTNYHITLTLKPTITTTSPRQGSLPSLSQRAMSRNEQYTQQRTVSSLAVYPDNTPGLTTSSLPYDRPSSARPPASPARSGRGTSTAIPPTRPRSRSRSATRCSDGQINFDVEIQSLSDEDQVVRTSTNKHHLNVTDYELQGPKISSSVEFTYSPPVHDDMVDYHRGRPTSTAQPRQRKPHHVQEEVPRSHHRPNQHHHRQHIPDTQPRDVSRTNNSRKPPKMTGVRDPHDSANIFNPYHRTEKENPAYLSDPDTPGKSGRQYLPPSDSSPDDDDDRIDPARRRPQENPNYSEPNETPSESEDPRRAPRNFAPTYDPNETPSESEDPRRAPRDFAPAYDPNETPSESEDPRRAPQNFAPAYDCQ